MENTLTLFIIQNQWIVVWLKSIENHGFEPIHGSKKNWGCPGNSPTSLGHPTIPSTSCSKEIQTWETQLTWVYPLVMANIAIENGHL